MALQPGDRAPDFETLTHTGEKIQLSEVWANSPVVLFFYPKAFTPGCTAEACHFRDLRSEFEKVGARIFGVSTDNVDKQSEFASEHGLSYTLLADPDGTVCKLYGVKRNLLPIAKRTTFVIDKGGEILEVVHNEFSMNVHADRALEVLAARGSDSDPENSS
ncbi:MAG: peroxiredoxin [Acidimicrobiia bacterium]